jgi:chemotaxis protein CheZ
MMAQDFQDLTGQVIKKVTELANGIEQQLVQLLLDYAPPDVRRDAGAGLLNGPQINPEGNPDVLAGQEQVDDLLDSLGF